MDNVTKVLIAAEPLGLQPDILLPVPQAPSANARYSYYLEVNGLLMKAGHIDIQEESRCIGLYTADTQRRLKQLMEEVTSADPPEFEDYLMHLRQIGVRYYQIIPENVRQYVKALPRDPVHFLYIYAPRHWIPWELIYDGEDFWGDKCVVVRIPVLNYTLNEQTRSVLDRGPHPILSVLNVIGNRVIEHVPHDHRSLLTLDSLCSQAPASACNIQDGNWMPMTIATVKGGAETASIIHFTCHGRFDEEFGYYLQLSSDPQHHRYRLYSSLLQNQFYLDNALVFVNACTSDVPSLQLGSFINLGQEFFESGADVFIGTLAPVPILRAVRLAAMFYERLLQGESVGIALHNTKTAMKEEGNPFWLFYCLYGNALKQYAA